ncbi:MAG: serine hydrolase domain-containing protein [Pseudomonadota bacterium]
MNIEGTCDARFQRVRDAFEQNFAERDEIGASVCIVIEGHPVVDLWGGHLDAARTKPWTRDTVVNVWSLGKAMSALALLHLMDQGTITPESQVAAAWPEFAAADKSAVTYAQLMSHQAGLCAIDAPLPRDAFFHWDLMTRALAAQQPWWTPGEHHGYHTNTFGFLLGEPVRRLTGSSLRDYFRQHIAGPLDADFYMGVPKSELYRCADLVQAPRPAHARTVVPDASRVAEPLDQMRLKIYNNPSLSDYDHNSPAWRMAEFPSTSPQSNARSVARIFGALANILATGRSGILGPAILRQASEIYSDGEDLNIQRPTRFGLGLQLTQPDRPLGPNPGTFGHYGNGGHLGFADPTVNMGFAYHMNHQGYAWRDPRNIALTDAVYASL